MNGKIGALSTLGGIALGAGLMYVLDPDRGARRRLRLRRQLKHGSRKAVALALGARRDCVEVTGSIKFDLQIDAGLVQRAAELRRAWQAEQRPLWIAASTHAGEDEIVLAAHRQLLVSKPDALLILVPRHPERFNSVHQLCLHQGLTTRRRSTGEAVQAGDQVLLGDSMGELLFLYALADVAFVGGSLVPRGSNSFS